MDFNKNLVEVFRQVFIEDLPQKYWGTSINEHEVFAGSWGRDEDLNKVFIKDLVYQSALWSVW